MDSETDLLPMDGSDEDILDKTLSASLGDETEPLMPILESPDRANIENNNDEDSRKEELKLRLASALKKLEKSEKSIDANWSLDYSLTTMKNELVAETLPRHVEDNVKGIILSAEDYISKLDDQLSDLDIADEQIVESTRRVMKEIDDTYQHFLNRVCEEINKKRDLMRLEAEVYMYESLGPLKGCRQQVNAQLRSTRNLVNELSRALIDTTIGKSQECKIIEASSHLGRIPAVPQPEELPYVKFSPPPKTIIEKTLREISELGSILRMGPAPIVEIDERPGSLFVKWQIEDPDYANDEQTFVVQRANGEIHDLNFDGFETIYEGTETSCFVRDLQVDCPVTLRIGLRAMETAWSGHRFARTKIPPYSWSLDNKDYMVTNGGKVAAKISDRTSTLFSRCPQVDANQIIEFKFLEVSTDGRDTEGIALVAEISNNEDDLRKFGSLMITPNGKIYMDGDEKLMRLPRIRLGGRIVFAIQRKDDETLRINIESGEKAVTYDWTVQTPLYFAARFREFNKWNLMVR